MPGASAGSAPGTGRRRPAAESTVGLTDGMAIMLPSAEVVDNSTIARAPSRSDSIGVHSAALRGSDDHVRRRGAPPPFPGPSIERMAGRSPCSTAPAARRSPTRSSRRSRPTTGRRTRTTAAPFLTSRRSDAVVHEAHEAMADLLGAADASEIKFGANMTSLTFHVSRSIGATMAPGDEIVVTILDHEGNVGPWKAIAADRGLVVRTLDIRDADCTLALDQLDDLLTDRTRLVAVGWASNAVGTINPVAEIVRRAHAAGAWTYLDAVHAAPHLPIDVRAVGTDFLACSTYKFFGPHAGVLYGRADVLDGLPAYKLRPAEDRFETGTAQLRGAGRRDGGGRVPRRDRRRLRRRAGAAPARRERIVAGMTAIRAYEMDLYRRLADGLEAIPRPDPVRDHRPGAVRRADADGGAPARGDRAAGGRGGARRGRDRRLGRRLLRDRPDGAARAARPRRRRPDRADPLQHGGRGRPAGRRAGADRGSRRPTGRRSRSADAPGRGPRAAPDVAVIGGGIVGTATATFLADAGLRVRLYERTAIAAGASGRNSGIVQQPVRPGPCRALPADARRLSRPGSRDGRRLPVTGRARRAAVRRSRRRPRAAEAARWAAAWPATRPEVLGGAALRALEPALAPDLVACRLEIGFPVPPASATRPSPRSPRRRGRRDRDRRREARPAVDRPRVVGVEREGVLEPAGSRRRRRGAVDTGDRRPVGRLAPDPRRRGASSRRSRSTGRRATAWRPSTSTIEPGRTRHGPRMGRAPPVRRRTSPSASSPPPARARSARRSSTDEPDPAAWVDALRRVGARYVPAVADAPLVGLRHCARPVSLDGRPLVGPAPWCRRPVDRAPAMAVGDLDRPRVRSTARATGCSVRGPRRSPPRSPSDRFGEPPVSARIRRRTGRTSAATSARGARPSVRRGSAPVPAARRPRSSATIGGASSRRRSVPLGAANASVGARPGGASPRGSARSPRSRSPAAALRLATGPLGSAAGVVSSAGDPDPAPRRRAQLDRAPPRRPRQAAGPGLRPGVRRSRPTASSGRSTSTPPSASTTASSRPSTGSASASTPSTTSRPTIPTSCYVFDPLLVAAAARSRSARASRTGPTSRRSSAAGWSTAASRSSAGSRRPARSRAATRSGSGDDLFVIGRTLRTNDARRAPARGDRRRRRPDRRRPVLEGSRRARPPDVRDLAGQRRPRGRVPAAAAGGAVGVARASSAIRLVEVPEEEYPTLGCNVLAVRPGVVVVADGNPATRRGLEAAGVEVHAIPLREVGENGSGGVTCLTRPLLREA